MPVLACGQAAGGRNIAISTQKIAITAEPNLLIRIALLKRQYSGM
jgi:hypothetical protein